MSPFSISRSRTGCDSLSRLVPAGWWGRRALVLGIAVAATAAVLAAADPLQQCVERAEAAATAGSTTVVGRDGWLYFAPELRHLGAGRFWGAEAAKVSRATKPEQADPLPVIVDFKNQLARAGIELIVVPVPPKALIYPEHLLEGTVPAARFDAAHEAFYRELRAAGVAVLDLVPEFMAQKAAAQVYCRQDTHWSGAACVLVARSLAREIRHRPWFEGVAQRTFEDETRDVEITGDLWRELPGAKPPKETLPLRFVGTRAGGSLDPVPPDAKSPIVLLGDSHDLVFHAGGDMHAVGAGLPDQLARELGFAVDLVAVRGSGATPARINLMRRAKVPDYLAGKKLVIWCFAAREFTESPGWLKVPVVR